MKPFTFTSKLTASIVAVAIMTNSPIPSALAVNERTPLPAQTEIIGGLWDGVRPLLDVQNPTDDQTFYTVPDEADMESLDPGTVLRERTFDYHIATIPTPLKVTQVLYVTTNSKGEHEQNVTSIVHPPQGSDGNVLSYQSVYDSSNPADNPSREIAGNLSLGGLIPALESAVLLPALLQGHPVIIADTQGKDANFAAGPAYGAATLDSLRASIAASTSPVEKSDHIGLFGYSGGSIASNWAAARLKSYAPELESRIVGVAQGGMFINPANNLDYAGDGLLWSGVVGLALASLGDSYGVDFTQYFNSYGVSVVKDVRNLSIIEAMGRYPETKWSDLARPEYPTPQSAPEVKRIIEDINVGNWDASTLPMMVFQGAGGFFEGTPESKTLGPGDGVMVTRDIRSIVRKYCAAGAQIEYREYPWLSHGIAAVPWAVEGYLWLDARFRGVPATNNCATVPEGNEL